MVKNKKRLGTLISGWVKIYFWWLAFDYLSLSEATSFLSFFFFFFDERKYIIEKAKRHKNKGGNRPGVLSDRLYKRWGAMNFLNSNLDQEWAALLASLLISLTSATKFSNFHCVAYSSYIESPSLVKVQTSPLSTLHHPCLLATCKNGLLLVCTTLGNGFDHTSACELWGVFCEAIIRNRWVSWLQNLSQQMLWRGHF